MRCKKHLTDQSSSVGFCASCLREKLLPLLAVQSPPLIFPRSVSPPRVPNPNRLFFSTPQLRPIPTVDFPSVKKRTTFSLLPKFLRSGSTSSSNSWISTLFLKKKKKTSEPVCRRAFSGRGRGMSPARVSDCGGGEEGFDCAETSGYSTEGWRQTPRRRGSGNMAAFCLSPMVRPSPKRRSANEPNLAAAFCANRSRKMADFGRPSRPV